MRHIRLALVALCVTGTAWLVSGGVAAAHVLRQDGPAAAVMHIEPDDNPRAGQSTVIVFDFNDSPASFSLRDYTTMISVRSDAGGNQTTPLEASYSRVGRATVRFTTPGIYDIDVHGTAAQTGLRFNLTYEIKVGGSSANTGDPAGAQTVAMVSIAGFCVLALVARRCIVDGGRYARKS